MALSSPFTELADWAPQRKDLQMFNVCVNCGHYHVDKEVTDPATSVEFSHPRSPDHWQQDAWLAFATCPRCGRAYPFLQLPLLLVGGASAAGKTAILHELSGRFAAAVLLEADLLWLREFEAPSDGHRRFFETWLRMAKNIGQSGRPAALFGAGLAVPENIEQCLERRYFGRVHYLALVCEEDLLRQRLLARPAWRKSGQAEQLAAQLNFNRWLQTDGPHQTPPVTLLDTTGTSVRDSAIAVKGWMKHALASAMPGTT